MAIIKSVRGFTPVIGENTFLADNATVIGDATIGRDCSIWFSAVVRGDVNKITIGDRVNIQDGAVIHTLYQRSVTEIGNDVFGSTWNYTDFAVYVPAELYEDFASVSDTYWQQYLVSAGKLHTLDEAEMVA